MTARESSSAGKAALRRELRRRRRTLPASLAMAHARRCAAILTQSQLWRRSAHIALYLARDGELDPGCIAEAARRQGRRLYLPQVHGDVLEFADWNPSVRLQPNRFGIGEPTGPPRALRLLDVLLLPLVGWTREGTRLGMGAGFYDRSLAQAGARPFLLGVAHECQRVDDLPADPWDVPLDAVLTERGLYDCRRRSLGPRDAPL